MKSRHPGEDAAANDERGKKRRSYRSPSSGERSWEIGDTVGGEALQRLQDASQRHERSRHDERPRPGEAENGRRGEISEEVLDEPVQT
jgi:hypothetical protein